MAASGGPAEAAAERLAASGGPRQPRRAPTPTVAKTAPSPTRPRRWPGRAPAAPSGRRAGHGFSGTVRPRRPPRVGRDRRRDRCNGAAGGASPYLLRRHRERRAPGGGHARTAAKPGACSAMPRTKATSKTPSKRWSARAPASWRISASRARIWISSPGHLANFLSSTRANPTSCSSRTCPSISRQSADWLLRLRCRRPYREADGGRVKNCRAKANYQPGTTKPGSATSTIADCTDALPNPSSVRPNPVRFVGELPFRT